MEGGTEFDLKALDAEENQPDGTQNRRTTSESQATKRFDSVVLFYNCICACTWTSVPAC
jgi:hypothetical protein